MAGVWILSPSPRRAAWTHAASTAIAFSPRGVVRDVYVGVRSFRSEPSHVPDPTPCHRALEDLGRRAGQPGSQAGVVDLPRDPATHLGRSPRLGSDPAGPLGVRRLQGEVEGGRADAPG